MTDAQIREMIERAAVDAATAAAAPLLARINSMETRLNLIDGGSKADFEGPAPFSVHLIADPSRVTPENCDSVAVAWDFGDPAGQRNRMAGMNAGHAYDVPGVYTASVTIAGVVQTLKIKVADNDRRSVYLASDGDDAKDGKSEATRVRTWNRAIALSRGDRVQVLIKAGDRIEATQTMRAGGDFFRIATYGLGNNAAVFVDYKKPPIGAILDAAASKNFVIERITLETADAIANDQKAMPHGIIASGSSILIRRCEANRVGYLINGNGRPTGVLVSECLAPDDDDLRAYLAWCEGVNWVFLDNKAVNSTREHVIRTNADYVNIQSNDFENKDRRGADPATGKPVDSSDLHKSILNIQRGKMIYVASNILRGAPVFIGPLGGGDGRPAETSDARTRGIVVEANRMPGVQLQIQHGTEYLTVRNNLFSSPWGNFAIVLQPYNADYKRGVAFAKFSSNTLQASERIGNMFRIGSGSKKIAITRNLSATPNYELGAYATAALFIEDQGTAEVAVAENVWASPAKVNKTPGIPIIVGGAYVTGAEWASVTKSDRFVTVSNKDYQSSGAGVNPAFLPPL